MLLGEARPEMRTELCGFIFESFPDPREKSRFLVLAGKAGAAEMAKEFVCHWRQSPRPVGMPNMKDPAWSDILWDDWLESWGNTAGETAALGEAFPMIRNEVMEILLRSYLIGRDSEMYMKAVCGVGAIEMAKLMKQPLSYGVAVAGLTEACRTGQKECAMWIAEKLEKGRTPPAGKILALAAANRQHEMMKWLQERYGPLSLARWLWDYSAWANKNHVQDRHEASYRPEDEAFLRDHGILQTERNITNFFRWKGDQEDYQRHPGRYPDSTWFYSLVPEPCPPADASEEEEY
jgi:hypothetical protein